MDEPKAKGLFVSGDIIGNLKGNADTATKVNKALTVGNKTFDGSEAVTINASDLGFTTFKPKGKSYLTFSSPNSFTLKVNDETKHWDSTLEYFASNKTWTTWDGTATLSSADNDGEYVLYLRGSGNTVITGNNSNYRWVLTGTNIACIGNIENLLDYATVESGAHPTMASYCYYRMFNGCTALTQVPALPATILAIDCYHSMFRDCTSLTTAPALPATTLANDCYNSMFYGCTSLTQAPALPATTLADSCYYRMFANCTSLINAPALPATILAIDCYHSIFRGCASLTQAPALPATTLANNCYDGMFYGCTSLKLSTTQTGEYMVAYRIPESGTGTTATNALDSMFTSTGGTFKGTPSINTTYYLSNTNTVSGSGYNGVFSAGTTAPSNTKLLWIDTTATTGGLKYYNGSAWVHVPVAFTG